MNGRPVRVAIIGAGPTGIAAATLLAQYGVAANDRRVTWLRMAASQADEAGIGRHDIDGTPATGCRGRVRAHGPFGTWSEGRPQ